MTRSLKNNIFWFTNLKKYITSVFLRKDCQYTYIDYNPWLCLIPSQLPFEGDFHELSSLENIYDIWKIFISKLYDFMYKNGTVLFSISPHSFGCIQRILVFRLSSYLLNSVKPFWIYSLVFVSRDAGTNIQINGQKLYETYVWFHTFHKSMDSWWLRKNYITWIRSIWRFFFKFAANKHEKVIFLIMYALKS